MSERNPISIDRKYVKASTLLALAGGVAFGLSGCKEPERDIHDGNLVDKWHEPERTYLSTNISLDYEGNITTSISTKFDDEDWGITIENCLEDVVDPDCKVKSYYVTEVLYDSVNVGDRVLITENPDVY